MEGWHCWELWATTLFTEKPASYLKSIFLPRVLVDESDTWAAIEMRRLAEADYTDYSSTSHSQIDPTHWPGFILILFLLDGQHARIHPAIKGVMCSDGRTERWARSWSCLFHNPFINKVEQKTKKFSSGSDIHHIVWCCSLEGTGWAGLLTLM